MPNFRKKPVVIDAWRFSDVYAQHPLFVRDALEQGWIYWQGGDDPHYTITTLEGTMRAGIGDWIIKGVKGEHYPCKHDIFMMTYEPDLSSPQETASD